MVLRVWNFVDNLTINFDKLANASTRFSMETSAGLPNSKLSTDNILC